MDTNPTVSPTECRAPSQDAAAQIVGRNTDQIDERLGQALQDKALQDDPEGPLATLIKGLRAVNETLAVHAAWTQERAEDVDGRMVTLARQHQQITTQLRIIEAKIGSVILAVAARAHPVDASGMDDLDRQAADIAAATGQRTWIVRHGVEIAVSAPTSGQAITMWRHELRRRILADPLDGWGITESHARELSPG